jgi:hypothetical protein
MQMQAQERHGDLLARQCHSPRRTLHQPALPSRTLDNKARSFTYSNSGLANLSISNLLRRIAGRCANAKRGLYLRAELAAANVECGCAMRFPSDSIQAAKKMRGLLAVVALLYVGSYLAGWYLISVKSPVAVQTAQLITGSVLTQSPFTTIVQSLRSGELAQAILITFLVNLTSGAFFTTTLPGIVPLVGAFFPIVVTLMRGFVIGITYPAILASSLGDFALGFGTMILELGAYVFSGAAGIHIALAPVMPKRYGVEGRLAAFKVAWKDAFRIYPIVIILLALGAIWEMTGIVLVLRPA